MDLGEKLVFNREEADQLTEGWYRENLGAELTGSLLVAHWNGERWQWLDYEDDKDSGHNSVDWPVTKVLSKEGWPL